MTATASAATDPDERIRLYAEAEDILAREEVAYIPIFHSIALDLYKPWIVNRVVPAPGGGGFEFYNWRIDVAAQQAAKGE